MYYFIIAIKFGVCFISFHSHAYNEPYFISWFT